MLRPAADARAHAAVQVRPWMIVSAALLLGGAVRASFVFSGDFPLNDGGMFYAMIEDLLSAHLALPDTASYNHADIPFAYPPLSLYAAALLSALTPLETLDTLRVLPLLISTLTIGAFFLLARRLFSAHMGVVVATFSFALVPRSFLWMIMGGGLTRSFGFLFSLLALHQAHRMYTDRSRSATALLGLFGGLTILSHLEMAWFLAFSTAAMWFAFGRDRQGTHATLMAASAALALSAPWWLLILLRHGAAPFVAASGTGGLWEATAIIASLYLKATGEELFPIVLALGLLGALACVASRRLYLPAWLALIAILDPRSYPTLASVPLAIMAGIAVTDVLAPLIARLSRSFAAPDRRATLRPIGAPSRVLGPALLVISLAYAAVSSVVSGSQTLAPLAPEERAAMAWVAENTPADATFAVISGESWAKDRASEWFPVLAERTSVATPQGREWLPGFRDRVEAHKKLHACAMNDVRCLDEWVGETGLSFTHIYVSKSVPSTLQRYALQECCLGLRQSLLHDPRFSILFDGPGATIFRRR